MSEHTHLDFYVDRPVEGLEQGTYVSIMLDSGKVWVRRQLPESQREAVEEAIADGRLLLMTPFRHGAGLAAALAALRHAYDDELLPPEDETPCLRLMP